MISLTFLFWWLIAFSTGFVFGDRVRAIASRAITKPKRKDPHQDAYDVPERGAEEE